MAERRMFSKSITESDAFLDLPFSAQALYFHMAMNADDEGFINSSRRICGMCGAQENDLKILVAKGFMIHFDSGIYVIKGYDENGKPNAMNAAWGGISEETQISICVDDGHKTAKNVVKTGAFTVSIADAENVVACDYVGIVSGNKETDKIEKAGWHATKSEFVDAPLFDELPMALECKLISYDEETCRLVGEIVNVCADEKILDENGKIDLNKFSPITYDPVHHTYRKIGDVVGKAFSDGLKLKEE